MIPLRRRWAVVVLAVAAAFTVASSCARPITPAARSYAASPWSFPAASWDSIADPRSVGWSPEALDSVRARLAATPTTGFMAVVGGRVLMTYGDVQAVSYLASVRKSVLAMMMGNYVKRGTIDLNKSLAQLGIDDLGGLSDREKEATVKDLITARSGIYHLASNAGDDTDSAPPRGSQKHGSYFLYNNWDFNAAGAAFEIMTGRDIYDALETDVVRPIEMQDFNRAIHRKTGDSTRSKYLAYHMNFSTRDMARIGYLMLRRGEWNGKRVVPAEWVDEISRAYTHVADMHPSNHRKGPFGYGYLWWVWDGPYAAGPYEGAYTGLGAVGQHITVIPKLDLVVAHKTRPGQRDSLGRPLSVSHPKFLEILDGLVRSHR